MEEGCNYYENVFPSHRLTWIGATKQAVFGRAIGGLLCGVRRSPIFDKIISLEKNNNMLLVNVRIGNDNICVLPMYLNYNNWHQDFVSLESWCIENFNKKLIICGDLNGRIGEEQDFTEICNELDLGTFEYKRKSKDKITNANGKKLLALFGDNDMVILNCRSPGDLEGDYTFISNQGRSVIDYCVASSTAVTYVVDFKVELEHFSDNLPVSFRLKTGGVVRDKANPLLPRLVWREGAADCYRRNLERLVGSDFPGDDIEHRAEHLVDYIRAAAYYNPLAGTSTKEYRQPWFDAECERARRRVFAHLRASQDDDNVLTLGAYCRARDYYKNTCLRKSREFRESIIRDLRSCRNSKDFWSMVKHFTKRKKRIVGNISLCDWISHFSCLLNPVCREDVINFAEPMIICPLQDADFTMGELKEVLASLRDGKAPGQDRVPYEHYKYAPAVFLSELLSLFNEMFRSGRCPSNYVDSVIYPLLKKGDPEMVSNYRGLSFINTGSKIYSGLLLKRINGFISRENVLCENQMGFRKSYSTVDCIFVLSNLAKLRLSNKGGKLYVFYVDFKACFDTINREALFYKLYDLGFSTKLVRALRGLYTGTRAAVWVNEGITEYFDVKSGLKQGCLISPTAFSLYLNDLADQLPCGVVVGGVKISMLAYADDLVLLATTPAELQRNINALKMYCDKWNLIVNLLKSKCMIFRRGGPVAARESWTFGEEVIETVNQYKYLGVTLTPRLSFSKHFKQKVPVAKYAINVVWRHLFMDSRVTLKTKLDVYMAVVRSILCYAAQVWGCQRFEEIEKVQMYFIRKVFWLPDRAPHYMLHLETGLVPLYVHCLELHLKYLKKVFAMGPKRFPRIVALAACDGDVGGFELLRDLQIRTGVTLDYSSLSGSKIREVLGKLREEHWDSCRERARNTSHYTWYKRLNHDVQCAGFGSVGSNTFDVVRWILKIRTELLNLNYQPCLEDRIELCSLCNRRAREDIFHFICECPILREFRVRWLGYVEMPQHAFITMLDSPNKWKALIAYVRRAWGYRRELVREFNYN